MFSPGDSIPRIEVSVSAFPGFEALAFGMHGGANPTTDPSISELAWRGDTAKMLRMVEESGYQWPKNTTSWAAENGRTETMLAAVNAGCPWSDDTTAFAARNGHMDTMAAAVRHGCPWSEDTTAFAASNGHTEIMLWAVANGCPWSEDTIMFANEDGHNNDTIRAAQQHGCPPDDDHADHDDGRVYFV